LSMAFEGSCPGCALVAVAVASRATFCATVTAPEVAVATATVPAAWAGITTAPDVAVATATVPAAW
jgi:hypothetical protein